MQVTVTGGAGFIGTHLVAALTARGHRVVVARREAREVEYSLADEHLAHIVLDAIRHTQER